MNASRFLTTLALALCCAGAAWAQVPALAGAPTDRPMPPEPGQRQGRDPNATDLPQADVRTLSEQREMNVEADGTPANAGQAPPASTVGREQVVRPAVVATPARTPAMRGGSDFDRTVSDRFAAYDRDLQSRRAALAGLSGNARTEQSYRLIQLRRQRDALGLQQRALARASASRRAAMERQLMTDLDRFDASMRSGN